MKNIFKLLLIAIAISFVGCDENDNPFLQTPNGFIQVDSESATITENSTSPIVTEVFIDAVRDSDFTVSYNLTSTDNSRFDITEGEVLTIPAGQVSASIVIVPIDNFEEDGNVDITIELLESNGVPVGIAGEGLFNASKSITLIDDDCALDFNQFVGTFDVDEDNGAFEYTANVELGSSPNTLFVDNWWGSGLGAEVTFDNSDLSNPLAFVLPQNTGVVLCCGAPTSVTSRPDPNAPASGPATAGLPDGTFSTCGLSFEADIYIYIPTLGTFNGQQSVNHVFTKQ